MHHEKLESINHAQKTRLFFIDFRLQFFGSVSRNDLINRFGIKEAASTRDIALYRELAPDNLEFDSKAKIYRFAETFSHLFPYTSQQVLAALSHGFGDDFVGQNKPLLNCETPSVLNQPSINVLSVLTRAIHQRQVLNIGYRSLSSGKTKREIIPFALVDNGLRWHTRAYDRRRERFTDFVITRISSPKFISSEIEENETKDFDNQWNRIVELEIVPHPSIKNKSTIELDFDMTNGMLKMDVRAAVAGYVLLRWNVDCSKDHHLNGKLKDGPTKDIHQLWLKNLESLYGVDNLFLAPGYEDQ